MGQVFRHTVAPLLLGALSLFPWHASGQPVARAPQSVVQWAVFETPPALVIAGGATGRQVAVRFDLLARAAATGGSYEVPLPDGTTAHVLIRSAGIEGNRTLLAGPLDRGRTGEAMLTAVGGMLLGRIVADGRVFAIEPIEGSTLHTITEVDPVNEPQGQQDTSEPAAEAAVLTPPPGQLGENGSRVDVLVLYTPAARFSAGSTARIEAEAYAAINAANVGLDNSGLTFRFNLVHVREIEYTESEISLSTDVDRLVAVNDGHADAAHVLRDQYRADLVTVFVAAPKLGFGGWARRIASGQLSVAAFQARAFNVVYWRQATSAMTLAHELGHNLGLDHDEANAGLSQVFDYAFGHRVQGVARDLMSYSCADDGLPECPRATMFSSPALFFPNTGVRAGTTRHDNARALTQTVPVAANFRDNTCGYVVRAVPDRFWKPGGTGQILVTTTAGCAWAAVASDTSVVTLRNTLTESQSAAVDFTVAATTTSRTISLIVAGQTVTLTQSNSLPAISISVHPQSRLMSRGESVTLSVAANSDDSPLTYQWRKSGTDISGATSSVLVLSNFKAGDAAAYTVMIRNSIVSLESNKAILAVRDLYSWCSGTQQTPEGGPRNPGGTSGTTCLARNGPGSFPLSGLQNARQPAVDSRFVYVPAGDGVAMFGLGLGFGGTETLQTALAGGATGAVDGSGFAARFDTPDAVVVDSAGTVYVSDTENHTIRRVSPAGQVTTLAGSAGLSGTANGAGALARFNAPRGIAIDSTGVLYVADGGNHAIRRISTGGIVTTLAGLPGSSGSSDGPGSTARFNAPVGLALDSSGGLWVSDAGNRTIRRITGLGDPSPAVTTIAGTAGAAGDADGTAAAARFDNMRHLAVDRDGSALLAQRFTVRRVTRAGEVTTIAGVAGTAGNTDGLEPLFRSAYGIAPTPSGDIFVMQESSSEYSVRFARLVVGPIVTTQPQSVTIEAGQAATFIVSATGSSLKYQWQSSADGGSTWTDLQSATDLTGQETATLAVSASAALNGRRYRCLVYNQAGFVTTAAAVLTVPIRAVAVAPSALFFAGTRPGTTLNAVTSAQRVRINAGQPTMTWTATANQPWVTVSPASGTGSASVAIGVAFTGTVPAPGTMTASVSFSVTGASNTPDPIAVTLTISSVSGLPTGSMDTPTDNATGLSGSLAVTGWALDDVEVTAVEIWRDPHPNDPVGAVLGGGSARGGKVFVGFASLVEGARPDVETANPAHPLNSRAGWGYLMLTRGLIWDNQGSFKLYAIAVDREGQLALIGSRTISIANAVSTRPFGAIDTPGQGAASSGMYPNTGWVLTPNTGASIPAASVQVAIDGVFLSGVPSVSARADISSGFPAFDTSQAGRGLFVDMTSLTNGVHTIGWFVTDSIGKADGIGSRFFTVLNDALTASGMAGSHDFPAATVNALPERAVSIAGRRGFDRDQPLRAFDAAAGEGFRAEELDRIELRLADGSEDRYSGFLRVGERLAPLPIGSSLSGGTFTWQPGAGFLGAYDFVFVRSEGSHPADRQEVRVVVHPQGTFTRPQVVVDMPSVNQRLDDGFTIGGWALDPDARSGTGVSLVQAWAYPVRGGRPVFLGTASMDGQRPDVAALYGAQFSASGFGLPVRHLAQGAYDLAVFAWSDAEGRFLPARIVRVTLR